MEEDHKTGRPPYDKEKLLKVVLFAFMEEGYESLQRMEKSSKTDIRYLWLLDGEKAPSHMTIDNFINQQLKGCMEDIFEEINQYIFQKKAVDLRHIYIDGTKITANANRYTWVWRKRCETSRKKVFGKVSEVLEVMNNSGVAQQGVKLGIREEYAIEYLENILAEYAKLMELQPETVMRERGHRKSPALRLYDKLAEYHGACEERSNFYCLRDKQTQFKRNTAFLDLFHDYDRAQVRRWLEHTFPSQSRSEVLRDTAGDLFCTVVRMATESGDMEKADAILDYILPREQEAELHEGIKLTSYEFDFVPIINFGSSEGIYIDCYLKGTFDESGRHSIHIGTLKTLRTDLEACKIMGELCGALMLIGKIQSDFRLSLYKFLNAAKS